MAREAPSSGHRSGTWAGEKGNGGDGREGSESGGRKNGEEVLEAELGEGDGVSSAGSGESGRGTVGRGDEEKSVPRPVLGRAVDCRRSSR